MEKEKATAVQNLLKCSKQRRKKKRSSFNKDMSFVEDEPSSGISLNREMTSFIPGIGDFSKGLSVHTSEGQSVQAAGANKYLVPLALSKSDQPQSENETRGRRSTRKAKNKSAKQFEEIKTQYREYSRVEMFSSRGKEEYKTTEVKIQSAQSRQIFFTQGEDGSSVSDDGNYEADYDDDAVDGENDDAVDDDIEEIKEEVVQLKRDFWRYAKTGRPALDRFRRVVDFVLITRKLFPCKRSILTQEESILFFVDIPNSSDTQLTSRCKTPDKSTDFDISPYRDIKEQNLLNNIRSVFELPSQCRSKEQIAMTMHLLRSYSSFAAYSSKTQRRFCSKAWISKFEASRVICRANQRAECMYLILVGVAIAQRVGKQHTNGTQDQEVATRILKKGDIIGEAEILEQRMRRDTVISKEALQVVGLDKEDVIDIFHNEIDESDIFFLKTIPALSLFPLHQLGEGIYNCKQRSYKHGITVARNSTESDYVYVVKSGSCNVLKAINCHDDIPRSQVSRRANVNCSKGDLTLPPIHTKKTKVNNALRMTRRKSLSDSSINLPRLIQGNGMVTKQHIQSQNQPTTTKVSSAAKASKRKRYIYQGTDLKRKDLDFEKPMAYAKLDILTAGGIFGLHHLIYEDTPGFALASNGCECLTIPKSFFLHHVNSTLLAQLKTKLSPYPTLENLQNGLEEQLWWDNYKEHITNHTQ